MPNQHTPEPIASDQLVAILQSAEQSAHHLGLIETAHAINRATNTAGYEIADKLMAALLPATTEAAS